MQGPRSVGLRPGLRLHLAAARGGDPVRRDGSRGVGVQLRGRRRDGGRPSGNDRPSPSRPRAGLTRLDPLPRIGRRVAARHADGSEPDVANSRGRDGWSGRQDSNLRSPAPKAGALATTLRPGCQRTTGSRASQRDVSLDEIGQCREVGGAGALLADADRPPRTGSSHRHAANPAAHTRRAPADSPRAPRRPPARSRRPAQTSQHRPRCRSGRDLRRLDRELVRGGDGVDVPERVDEALRGRDRAEPDRADTEQEPPGRRPSRRARRTRPTVAERRSTTPSEPSRARPRGVRRLPAALNPVVHGHREQPVRHVQRDARQGKAAVGPADEQGGGREHRRHSARSRRAAPSKRSSTAPAGSRPSTVDGYCVRHRRSEQPDYERPHRASRENDCCSRSLHNTHGPQPFAPSVSILPQLEPSGRGVPGNTAAARIRAMTSKWTPHDAFGRSVKDR